MTQRISLLLLSLALAACTGTVVRLANWAAVDRDYVVERSLAYGAGPEQRLDVYAPKGAQDLPVVVFFYGGCWGACQTITREDYRFLGEAVAEMGYLLVVPDYRLYPAVRFDAMMDDAAAAVAWTRQNASEFGGDPQRIVLMGHSAGAHMAALLYLDPERLDREHRQRISALVGLAGPYDFLPFTKDYQRELFGPASQWFRSQPVNYAANGEVPMLLLHGGADRSVSPMNQRSLSARINHAGGDSRTRIYPGLDHTGVLASLAKPVRARYPVFKDISAFLAELDEQ